ncbi:MAG: thioredoxin-disulfide reductase [Alphaproteobacteria bacterium]|nr:thioredoxin-disulfide reductase [Alphaproteobacteria bacterium]
MEHAHSKVVIIGSGPAGYTAAIYAARAALKPILIQGTQVGGQLTITTDVENFPGFVEPISGIALMDQMAAQAKRVGAKMVMDEVVGFDATERPFRCYCASGACYTGDTVIIATGAQARWLGSESETHFKGYGVSGCATCDGFFYRGKEVLVVGGGNSAMEEALYLSNLARKVTIIHRRDSFRGEKIQQERVLENGKIDVIWDSVLDEIYGEEEPHRSVTGVKIKNIKTDAITDLPVDGVFIAIGHAPATAVFKGQVPMDEQNYLITEAGTCSTKVPGIFAAGDVRDQVYRQAVTAAGMGCMAALEAERFLVAEECKPKKE